MEKSVVYQARNLSPEERRAAEVLLGGTLGEDDLVSIRTSKGRILKHAPTGAAREDAFRQLFGSLDRMANRAAGSPEAEIDALIDEAVDYVRHNPE